MNGVASLSLAVDLGAWVDFQQSLSRTLGLDLMLLDPQGGVVAGTRPDPLPCAALNPGGAVRHPACVAFYRAASPAAGPEAVRCPFGLWVAFRPLAAGDRPAAVLAVGPALAAAADEEGVRTATGAGPGAGAPVLAPPDLARRAQVVAVAAQETLRALLERRLLGLARLEWSALYHLSRLVTSVHDVEAVVALVLNSLVLLYQPRAVWLLQGTGDALQVTHARGPAAGDLLGRRVSPEAAPLRDAWQARNPVVAREGQPLADLGLPAVPDGGALVLLPLASPTVLLGLVGLSLPAPPADESLRNMEIFASFAAVALENARLVSLLRDQANTDALTGLLNRAGILGVLEQVLVYARRTGEAVSVLMLDMDNFKVMNDRYGHPYGDQVLRTLGEVLRQHLRRSDRAGRLGGDEFVLVLPGTPLAQVPNVYARLVESLRRQPWSHEAPLLSGGAAEAGRDETAASVVARADAALLAAKSSGKSRLMVHEGGETRT